MIVFERFVVRKVPRARPGQDGIDDTWVGPTDPTGGLNVCRRVLGLAIDDHEPYPIHVDTDRKHIGREYDVDRTGLSLLPSWLS